MAAVTYNGDGSFADLHIPTSGKSEWGMDTLVRHIGGAATGLVSYLAGLSQGATYSWNSNTYYLQSWDDDKNPVFPTVTLNYKGLNGGIPDPFTSGAQSDQTFSITCSSPQNASRTIRYITRSSEYKYIKSGRPTAATYTTCDITPVISIIDSYVTIEGGAPYYGSIPAGLLTALTPATYNLALMSCTPVFGTTFFECTDKVTFLYGP